MDDEPGWMGGERLGGLTGGLVWADGKNVCTARRGVYMCGVKNALRTG